MRKQKKHLIIAYMAQGWKLEDKAIFPMIQLEKYFLRHKNGNNMTIIVDSSLQTIDVLINNKLKDNFKVTIKK